MPWPMATTMTSAGMRTSGRSAVSGRGRPALSDLAGDLGLDPQGHGVAVLVGSRCGRGPCRVSSSAPSATAPVHLLRQGGHILLAAAVDAGDLLRAQADGAAGHVHGHVAAADDHHLLAGEVGHVAVADAPQHLHRGDDVLAVLAGDARPSCRCGRRWQMYRQSYSGLQLARR